MDRKIARAIRTIVLDMKGYATTKMASAIAPRLMADHASTWDF